MEVTKAATRGLLVTIVSMANVAIKTKSICFVDNMHDHVMIGLWGVDERYHFHTLFKSVFALGVLCFTWQETFASIYGLPSGFCILMPYKGMGLWRFAWIQSPWSCMSSLLENVSTVSFTLDIKEKGST
jgi:hypothetical protein